MFRPLSLLLVRGYRLMSVEGAGDGRQVQLAIKTPLRATAYGTAALLREAVIPEADAVSIFEEGASWRVDAYYGAAQTGEAALACLTEIAPEIADQASLTPVPDENWVALSQAALPPVFAGRFVVAGEHDRARVPDGPNTLIIEASEAFGTAHHATTYGCLLAIDRLTRTQTFANVLDLGTGSGILALAAKRALPGARILASDIDQRSIEVARDNARHNGLGERAGGPRFIVADGLGDPRLRQAQPFDLIVANILAGPLTEMAQEIVAALDNPATLVLSGILVEQARPVAMRYRSLGLTIKRQANHHGWATLVLERPGRDKARRQPTFNLYVPEDD